METASAVHFDLQNIIRAPCAAPCRRYLRFGGYDTNCTAACPRNTLEIAEVQLYHFGAATNAVVPNVTIATGDSVYVDPTNVSYPAGQVGGHWGRGVGT
jgi:hypothetical protein